MRLILVRHGRTASNVELLLDTAVPGPDLDEEGWVQAESLVHRLTQHPIQALYASDLTRTRQTATPLAQARGLPIAILPGLREIPAGPDEMGRDASRYIDVIQRWTLGDLGAALPGTPDGHGFFARFDAAIAQVHASGHECAALFSHGAALRTWVGDRVQGLTVDFKATQFFTNTGWMAIEGDAERGWTYVAGEGIVRRSVVTW